MRKIYLTILFLLFILQITFVSCAKRGVITGGLKDTLAPKIVNSLPKNYTTNFEGSTIKIVFDELIKVKDINKQLIISPPLKKRPIIIPQGSASKFISIKLQDTLQENTTYSFNFGQSITDNNEGNPYSQFKYVFSTGNYIDSLTVVGKIKDAVLQKPDNFVSILLYDNETFTDSTVYKQTPLYITNTLDSLKVFALENLKEGKYKIIALKDANSDNKFNPKTDKIGFLKDAISVPTDTLYLLELFKEEVAFKTESPKQQSTNKYFLPVSGDKKNIKITAKANNQDFKIKQADYFAKKADSIQIFIPKIETDSITFTIEKGEYNKTIKTKWSAKKETDSLQISAITKSNLRFREPFVLQSSTPIEQINKDKIVLLNKDSIAVPFTYIYKDFEQKIELDFEKQENQQYNIQFLPGAITDFYALQNDTINYNCSTKSFSDYGNLKVTLKNVKQFPIIIEILDKNLSVIASQFSEKETVFHFDTIDPALYILRVIYDENNNKIWDTGDYLKQKQPEQIIYFSNPVDVRANWDVDQTFDLNVQ